MADDASTTTSAPASGAPPSTPVYSNNPTDPTTWSPGYAAQQQAAVTAWNANQQSIQAAATLALMQPCAELAGPAPQARAAARRALASNLGGDDAPQADLNFVAMLRNAATADTMLAAEFDTRFKAVGGVAPTT